MTNNSAYFIRLLRGLKALNRVYHSTEFLAHHKNLTVNLCRDHHWKPTPVLLPGKSHGRLSLLGYSPWGCEESDTTDGLHFHFSLSCTGEGNSNPLQYSCLKNPRIGSLVGCCLWGRTQSDMTDVT